MKLIHKFNDSLKNKMEKRFESWKFSFSLKTCVTKGKCVTQGMSRMCHSGYVYCIIILSTCTIQIYVHVIDYNTLLIIWKDYIEFANSMRWWGLYCTRSCCTSRPDFANLNSDALAHGISCLGASVHTILPFDNPGQLLKSKRKLFQSWILTRSCRFW